MASKQGPRRQVLHYLTKGKQLGAEPDAIAANNIQIHSSSLPILQNGATFHATVDQTIKYDGTTKVIPTASQSFRVKPSKSTLDPTNIHSVYPPSGHSDFWNVLPHVLFNNLQTPWMMNSLETDDPKATIPWLGLLCFTHEELLLQPSDLKTIATTSPQAQGPNMAVTLTEAEYAAATNQTAGDAALPVNAVFIASELFNRIFSDPHRFEYLTHVRTVNTGGMTNMLGDEAGTYSVVVSARPGAQKPSEPTVVYAHLVALPPDNGASQRGFSKCGLRSLYSWQYTCLPSTHFALTKAFQTLATSVQSLRNPDSLLNQSQDSRDAWVKKRMLAGYSLGRYRPATGETTMCLFRGPLIPNDPFDSNLSSRDMPPSDIGTDLTVLDREVGMLDISFQLAWSLGRTLAMADRGFSAAWMRLRTVVHNAALNAAKKSTDKELAARKRNDVQVAGAESLSGVFQPILPVLSSLKDSGGKIQGSSQPAPTPSDGSQLVSRWGRSSTSVGTRTLCTFVNPDVKSSYVNHLDQAGFDVSMSHPPQQSLTSGSRDVTSGDPAPETYNETNQPASTDYALILGWILDKWFLQGIPTYNLLPDPAFLPQESIRKFYVDPTWFKTFIDGALSTGDHFTPTDDARETLKGNFTTYLNTKINDGPKPQIPRWGFFLRSAVVTKFPDLRISAPWNPDGTSGADDGLEVIRTERLDDDLLIALFDRIPGPKDRLFQVSLQPPEHQLCFMIGEFDGWDAPDGSNQVTIEWKAATVDGQRVGQNSLGPSVYKPTDSGPFDFTHNLIESETLATLARKNLQDTSNKSPAAILGAQLIASFPKLVLQGGGSGTPRRNLDPIRNSLTTTRQRVPNTLVRTQPRPERSISSSSSTVASPRPSESALPTHTLLRSQYPNLARLADVNVGDSSWYYDGSDGSWTGRDNMWCPYEADNDMWHQRLAVRIYNVADSGSGLYNTFAVMPLSLGLLTDLNVSVKLRNPNYPRGFLLSAFEVTFSVGDNYSHLGAFPASNPATQSPGLNTTPPASSPQDFAHKPSFTGVKLPTIRAVGLAPHRWTFTSSYTPPILNSPNPSGNQPAFLTIRACPNKGAANTLDILDIGDTLTFAIEDVQVNWVEPPDDNRLGAPQLKFWETRLESREWYAKAPGQEAGWDIYGLTYTKIAGLMQEKHFAPATIHRTIP